MTRISDVISSLEEIQRVYGDLPVIAEVPRFQFRADLVQVKQESLRRANNWPMNHAVIEVGSGRVDE